MPRGSRYSHGGSASGGSQLVAMDSILAKEGNYKRGIKENQTMANLLAETLALEGPLEKSMNQGSSDIGDFLKEQRERLKKVAETNVESMRSVDAFCAAIRQLRQEVESSQQEGQENDEPVDYERTIQDKMRQYQQNQASSQLDMADEDFCREIRSRLGEKEPARKKRGRSDDDDDDLEVLRQPDSIESLKCPILGAYFEDPVKNKSCNHVYSRAGIMQVIGLKKGCPIPGCPNRQVLLLQLEPDEEMKLKVRRQIKREEMEKRQRQSQVAYDDDDDEDEVHIG